MKILKPHVSLNVSNVDASVAFYERAFGVKATKRRPGYAKFDLAQPSLNLTMVEQPRTGENASHFGIQVESTADVLEAKADFEAAGLEVKTEEQVSCCYALQDKVWITDPDGNEWEIFTVLSDSATLERSFDGKAAEVGASCCAPPKAGDKPSACCAPSEAKTVASASCCAPTTSDAHEVACAV
jgi:catechol 2,3-dioxygenase-like lactoylglutathione lyase family enzyme